MNQILFGWKTGMGERDLAEESRNQHVELFVGGVSKEAIRATFDFHLNKGKVVNVIFSDHQSNLDGGYVGRSDQIVRDILSTPSSEERDSFLLGRDHFTPADDSLQELNAFASMFDEYFSIGFRHFHIDLGRYDNSVRLAKELIPRLKKMRPLASIELSLTRDDGVQFADELISYLPEIEDLPFDYLVVPTGSLVRDLKQVGSFAAEKVEEIGFWARKFGIKLKEHNADCLSILQLQRRCNLVHSLNIAPEVAWVQNSLLIEHAEARNIDYSILKCKIKSDRKWKKWTLLTDNQPDELIKLALHYYFKDNAFTTAFDDISRDIGYQNELKERLSSVFLRYHGNCNSNQATAATSNEANRMM